MRKILVGLLLIVALSSIAAFILIPAQLSVSSISIMKANENATFRNLSDQNKWTKWWPSQIKEDLRKDYFSFNGYNYQLTKKLYNAIEVNMVIGNKAFTGDIIITPISPDSIAVKWESTLITDNNPLNKILSYQQAKRIKNNMRVILDSLKSFSENKQRVYACNIQRTTVKDTFLVAAKLTTTHYPSTTEIYNLVETLKKYIESHGASKTNYPMLNVTTNDSIEYTTMVAIPTNKVLPDNGNIAFKILMSDKDKTLTAEVKGGLQNIKKAYEELNMYMKDYNLSSRVIDWQSLITDRSKETDSTKWITKIYIPVV
jgi:effector-binding domain-containing protein